MVLLAGLAVWWIWPEDDARAIRRQLNTLAQLWTYGPDESPIAKQRAIGRSKALLSQDVVLEINLQRHPTVRVNGRHALMEGVQQIRFGVRQLEVRLLDIQVELLPDRRHANASMTLSARIGTELEQEYQELKAALERNDDGWVVTRVQTVKTWGR
jgi:hypothetical protein